MYAMFRHLKMPSKVLSVPRRDQFKKRRLSIEGGAQDFPGDDFESSEGKKREENPKQYGKDVWGSRLHATKLGSLQTHDDFEGYCQIVSGDQDPTFLSSRSKQY